MGRVYRVCEDKLENKRTSSKIQEEVQQTHTQRLKAIWESQFKDWQNYAELELKLQESLSLTEDFKEGVRAHSERRRPNFQENKKYNF